MLRLPIKKNKMTMVAGPLDKGLAEDIYQGNIDLKKDKKTISNFFLNQL